MAKWAEINFPRCAELEAELVYTEKRLEHAFDRNDMQAKTIDYLTTKLAKAVELALEECPFRWGTPNYDNWWHHRRTTLAELKGQGDE